MSSAPTDRRVRRTRELLRNALLALILEQGYDRITVQDILDRADVGRSTFYAHYRDKDDLLHSGFEDIRAALAAETAGDTGGDRAEFLQPLLAVFRHVERHRPYWRAMAGKGGLDLIVRILRESVADIVHTHFRVQFAGVRPDDTQVEAGAQYVIGACMGLLTWWVDNDDTHSAEEIHATFQRLTTHDLRRVVGAA